MSPVTATTIPAARSPTPATRPSAKGIIINGLVILTPLAESFRPEHTNPPGGLEKANEIA